MTSSDIIFSEPSTYPCVWLASRYTHTREEGRERAREIQRERELDGSTTGWHENVNTRQGRREPSDGRLMDGNARVRKKNSETEIRFGPAHPATTSPSLAAHQAQLASPPCPTSPASPPPPPPCSTQCTASLPPLPARPSTRTSPPRRPPFVSGEWPGRRRRRLWYAAPVSWVRCL